MGEIPLKCVFTGFKGVKKLVENVSTFETFFAALRSTQYAVPGRDLTVELWRRLSSRWNVTGMIY